MTEREAVIRLAEALMLQLDALMDAIERGDELVEERGQYAHIQDIKRRYLLANPSPSAN